MLDSVKLLSGLLIIGIIVLSACKSSETSPIDRVSVGLHQSGRIGSDVVVRVDSIQDSRCPLGVTCIWAGQAKVKLLVSTATDSSVVRLLLGPDGSTKRPDSTAVSLNSQLYKVILREVNPYPGATNQGQSQVATVQVTKL